MAVGGNGVGVGGMGVGGRGTAVAAVVGSALGDSSAGFEAMRMQPASSKKTARKTAFLLTGFLNRIECHRYKISDSIGSIFDTNSPNRHELFGRIRDIREIRVGKILLYRQSGFLPGDNTAFHIVNIIETLLA